MELCPSPTVPSIQSQLSDLWGWGFRSSFEAHVQGCGAGTGYEEASIVGLSAVALWGQGTAVPGLHEVGSWRVP